MRKRRILKKEENEGRTGIGKSKKGLMLGRKKRIKVDRW